MFALLHSGVLWPSGLPTPFPDVWGQLHRGGGRALQLHRQADSGGKCHPHVWAGRKLDRLPAPLLRYGAWHGGGGPREQLANGRWTSSQACVWQEDGRKADLLNPRLIPNRQRAQLSEVPSGPQPVWSVPSLSHQSALAKFVQPRDCKPGRIQLFLQFEIPR